MGRPRSSKACYLSSLSLAWLLKFSGLVSFDAVYLQVDEFGSRSRASLRSLI